MEMQKTIKYSPLVTNAEFASLVGVSEGVIDGWVKRDYVPTVKLGKYRLINIAKLNSLLQEGEGSKSPMKARLDSATEEFDSLPRNQRRKFLKQAKNVKQVAVGLFIGSKQNGNL